MSSFLERRTTGKGDQESERLDEIVESIRAITDDAAKKLRIRVKFTEFQLHADDGEPIPLSKNRRARLHQNDVLVGFDTTPSTLARLGGPSSHPLQRGVVVLFSENERDTLAGLLGTNGVPLLNREKKAPSAVTRMFAVVTPLNEEEEALRHQENVATMSLVLSYPYTKPRVRSGLLTHAEGDSREAQPSFRQYLVERE